MSNCKRQLLEPITSLCRLILLNYYPKGTKVGINNHGVEIHQNNDSGSYIAMFLLASYRLRNNDSRENIYELYTTVIHLIEWYIIPLYCNINEQDISVYAIPDGKTHTFNKSILQISRDDAQAYLNVIKKLCTLLNTAFCKLQDTYENGNVVLALQYYINVINDSLDGKYNIEKLPRGVTSSENQNFLDYDKLMNLWNYESINEIYELYDKCSKLPPDNEKIKGYVTAIVKILDISDDTFRNLISESN